MYEQLLRDLEAQRPELLAKLRAELDCETDEERKIGDGKLLALLEKLLPLLIQFAPLFMGGDESGATDRKIGDGTLLNAIIAALSNPDFIASIAALVALFKK